jgi:hypothetical protein
MFKQTGKLAVAVTLVQYPGAARALQSDKRDAFWCLDLGQPMKRVTTNETALTPQDERLQEERFELADAEPLASECRALTVIGETAPRQAETPRRDAAFLTQLLAGKAGLPQTRERRREEPEVAANVYDGQMAPAPANHGKLLSRAA